MLGIEQYQKDAATLRKAMEGWGCDVGPIIEITAFRSNKDRQEILKAYKTAYGTDALEDIKSELSGDLRKAVQAMYRTPIDYDCYELRKAMKGFGTDEDTLIEIIGSRTTSQLKAVKTRYKELYKKDLEEEVKSETSGDLRRLFISLLQCGRSEVTHIDTVKLDAEVKELYNAGEGKWGTDESVFNRIFATRSFAELRYINKKYHEKTGKNLLDVLDSEFSGDLLKLYRTVIISLFNPVAYFARRIKDACKGLGTNDDLLIRVLVSRDEIDLKEIDRYYKENFNMTLKEQVEDECSGNYLKLLVALIKS